MKIFRPRPSRGWAWLVLMAVIIIAVAIAPAMAMGMSSTSVILTVVVCSLVALAFLALANQWLFRQPSFFKMQIEKVRSWREFRPKLDAIIGLGTAIFLIAWGAAVEMMP